MLLDKHYLAGNNLIIPGQGGFGCNIPAGDGKIADLFYSVTSAMNTASVQLYTGGKYSQLHDELRHSFTVGTISTFVRWR